MAHDHAASEQRRQQDEWTQALNDVKKYRQELQVAEGGLRNIAATTGVSRVNGQQVAQDTLEALARMRGK